MKETRTKAELRILLEALNQHKFEFVRNYKKNGPPMSMDELNQYKENIETMETIDKLISEFKQEFETAAE